MWRLTDCLSLCFACVVVQTRSLSGSEDDAPDDDCSPKSHSTQLINIPEMAAAVAAEQQQDKAIAAAAAAAAAAAVLEQQQQQAALDAALDIAGQQHLVEQRSVADASIDVMAAAGQQRRQLLQEAQQPSAGLNARPLASEGHVGDPVYAGDGEGGEDDPDRDLSVACQQAEENKLSFQLKFTEPEGELR